jgi:hypothetical protein
MFDILCFINKRLLFKEKKNTNILFSSSFYQSLSLKMYNSKSKNIRVPSNTHPSHLYGGGGDSSHHQATLSDTEEDDELFYSAQGTPVSRPQSIRTSIKNFAGSYSRASILYVADAISISEQQDQLDDEEQQLLFKTKTRYLETNLEKSRSHY